MGLNTINLNNNNLEDDNLEVDSTNFKLIETNEPKEFVRGELQKRLFFFAYSQYHGLEV